MRRVVRQGPDNQLGPWYHSTRPAVGGPLALFMSEVTRAERVASALTAMGYGRADAGGEIRLTGPDVQLRLQSASDGAAEGVREVQMRLRSSHAPRRFEFGGASLELSPRGLNDARAVWRFEPLRLG